MRYEWMVEYLLKKRGVTRDFQPVWNWIRYHVGGKMFAAICLDSKERPYYINLKLEPMKGEIFRRQYEDILPGYYSDKVHWNSIRPDGEVPDDLLKDMLDESYHLVLEGFSRKRQREILEITCCGADCKACRCYGKNCQGRYFMYRKGRPVRFTGARFTDSIGQAVPDAWSCHVRSGTPPKILP